MNATLFILRNRLLLVCFLGTCCSGSLVAEEHRGEAKIARTQKMPNLPRPFKMRDWSQVTRDYLDLVFTLDSQGKHLPLINRVDDGEKLVSFPSYVGGPRDPEAINYFAAVVSGTLVGIDMENYRGLDWVALGSTFFNADEGIYINRLKSPSGHSFWYDIFPNVLAYQIDALYPSDAERGKAALSVATRWQEVCTELGAKAEPISLPNFDHTGFNLVAKQPVEKGWIEPEAAAGIAWLEYMAWVKFQDPQFLTTADLALRSLEQRSPERSALYEVLLPYGALIAARMNAEQGSDYDVARLVNDCFEPRGLQQARPGWGVISDDWQGSDVHGLVGSTTDGQGYAFAMNTFQWAGALVPLARYDTRYAHDIGKWMLNLANASRLYYPKFHDALHQSSSSWTEIHDPKSVIAYEGIRKWKRGSQTARADYKTVGGRVVGGSFESTRFRREVPADVQVFEEITESGTAFEHVWRFDLPEESERWLVVSAERIDGGHIDNSFRFSFSDRADGPYTFAFAVDGDESAQSVALPAALHNNLFVKVEGNKPTTISQGPDRLVVDAMAISHRSNIGPFAQGDTVVTFVALLNDATVPIVLYRPESATTDLGLYGSSHVGILGGIIERTNIPAVLKLDLLKTDFFHIKAYPTFLYYNPCSTAKTIAIDVGPAPIDLYDAASGQFLASNVFGRTDFTISSDHARVIVVAPAHGKLRQEENRILINDVVVKYTN